MTVDVGEYCRTVEDHLTRVNGGHLIRIVGPAFELVRQWAEAGVPASVVLRGIDLKAERHRLGNSTRPLRLEFCEADVRDVYRNWRRAVGLLGSEGAENGEAIAEDAAAGGAGQGADSDSQEDQKDRKERRPSLTRHERTSTWEQTGVRRNTWFARRYKRSIGATCSHLPRPGQHLDTP